MPFQGGEAVPVTEDGGYVAFESWDGKMLYYLKTLYPDQLFAKPLAGGPERPIISTSILGRALYPVQGGLYFIGSGPAPATPTLEFYDLSTGRRRVLAAIKGRLRLGLTVSPDRKSVLFSLNRTSEADLILIENFR
jgi:Tol biopolymer transport system component